MTTDNAYYKARINAIHENNHRFEKHRRQLQYGFVDIEIQNEFDKIIKNCKSNVDNSPLDFTELCTYNTWYLLHPEKVCGNMVGNNSIYMPIKVNGTRKDIETAITAAINKVESDNVTVEKYRQKLIDDFGFVMVNVDITNSFENINQICKDTYLAFTEFAMLINKPHKFMSFNGNLSLALGSKFMEQEIGAYYEPAVRRIVVRKEVRHIAHEWFHGFDHYLCYTSTKRNGLISRQLNILPLSSFVANRETILKLREIVLYIPDTNYYGKSKKYCNTFGADKNYCLDIAELLARAFERYILDIGGSKNLVSDASDIWLYPDYKTDTRLKKLFGELIELMK